MSQTSKVLTCRAYRWQGVEVTPYTADPAPFKDVTRQTLLGERPGEEPLQFITRYFEVQPGGYSTLELHQHPHAVIVLRGTGQVVLDTERRAIAPYDCVYVAPGTTHQFRATGNEPLGFLCVVDRVRDRPRVIKEES
jgi:mannose-6-phosphate isomerase-like protein (cupin superfamily)